MQNIKLTLANNAANKSSNHSANNKLQQQAIETTHKNRLKKDDISLASVKSQGNKAILLANMEASVSAGNEPMQLLYKVAIENINKVLDADGVDHNALQKSYESGLDFSPQATADRILGMSTAFFSQFRDQQPELAYDQALSSFVKTIAEGINRGFTEARGVLEGLNVLAGDIASNIDTTYELVQQGLQLFENKNS